MNTEQLFNAVAELREAAGDGPRARKLLDALFRDVHSLKANAAVSGLNGLAAAAHEVENVLHSLRTGSQTADAPPIPVDIWNSLKQEQKHSVQQAIAEGARLFLVQTNFDLADFDRKFQRLKDALNEMGEVISTWPTIDNAHPGKLNFRILYAETGDAVKNIPALTIEELALTSSEPATNEFQIHLPELERCLGKLSAELGQVPAAPFGDVFEQAVRAGRSVAASTGKQVDFEVRGQDLKLDERLRGVIGDLLVHLVRNAVDHGIETSEGREKYRKNPRGKIVIEVANLGGQIRITVTDDGRGIDPSVLEQVFRPGFSTAPEISEISGRGVGLDAVKTAVEEAGGSLSVRSRILRGSTFEITLPS